MKIYQKTACFIFIVSTFNNAQCNPSAFDIIYEKEQANQKFFQPGWIIDRIKRGDVEGVKKEIELDPMILFNKSKEINIAAAYAYNEARSEQPEGLDIYEQIIDIIANNIKKLVPKLPKNIRQDKINDFERDGNQLKSWAHSSLFTYDPRENGSKSAFQEYRKGAGAEAAKAFKAIYKKEQNSPKLFQPGWIIERIRNGDAQGVEKEIEFDPQILVRNKSIASFATHSYAKAESKNIEAYNKIIDIIAKGIDKLVTNPPKNLEKKELDELKLTSENLRGWSHSRSSTQEPKKV